MELVYIYHSGFALLGDGYTVVMDYYRDTEDKQAEAALRRLMNEQPEEPVVAPEQGKVHDELLHRPGKLYVLASHFHPDHFNKEVLDWKTQRPDIIYIFSKDILKHRRAQKEDAVWLKKGEEYADETLSVRAFGSTDVGVSFLIEVENKKFFHAGDLNNWHWMEESTEQEWKGYEKNFLYEVDNLYDYTHELDVAMFPVDPRLGREYMRGPEQFVKRIKTNIFVPMHFAPDYGKANAFRALAETHGTHFIEIKYPGKIIKI